MMFSDRALAIAAAITVLVLASVQIAGHRDRGGVLPEVRALQALVTQGDMDKATALSQELLLRHPYYRPLHFSTARVMAARGFASSTLEHLVLATAPDPTPSASLEVAALDACPPPEKRGPLPHPSDVRAILEDITARYPDDVASPVGQYRVERLSRFMQPAQRKPEDFLRRITDVPVQQNAHPTSASEYAAVGFVLDIPSGAVRQQDPDGIHTRALLEALGTTETRTPSCATASTSQTYLTVVASGQSPYSLAAQEQTLVGPAGSGWWFVAVAGEDQRVAAQSRFCFPDLGDSEPAFREWVDNLPRSSMIVGCASGGAVSGMSNGSRDMLRQMFGLQRIPAAETRLSYAFAACLQSTADTVEATALASDLPAVLVLEPGA